MQTGPSGTHDKQLVANCDPTICSSDWMDIIETLPDVPSHQNPKEWRDMESYHVVSAYPIHLGKLFPIGNSEHKRYVMLHNES